ncbi:MAG: hypothetical protein R6W77_09405 [Trueperaceae bacterium]
MTPLETVWGALALRPESFAPAASGSGLRLALSVVFFAGLSQAVGQSLVLFANRVSPRRFVASLILFATVFTTTFLFWAATVWLIAGRLFDHPRPFATAVAAVGLAYAPQLLAFFTLTPYFGSLLWIVLTTWTLIAIVIATQVTFDLATPRAIAAAALGWVLLQALQRTLGRPVARWNTRLKHLVAGRVLAPLRAALPQDTLEGDARTPDKDPPTSATANDANGPES